MGARVGDVDGAEVRREGDAVRLLQRGLNDVDGAGGRAEPVGGGGELWGGVGQGVEPAVFCTNGLETRKCLRGKGFKRSKQNCGQHTGICKPDIAIGVDEEVVDGVEVVAEVIVQQGCCFIGCWVESLDSNSLFDAANTGIAARGSPVNQTIMKCAAVGCIDWWIREILG